MGHGVCGVECGVDSYPAECPMGTVCHFPSAPRVVTNCSGTALSCTCDVAEWRVRTTWHVDVAGFTNLEKDLGLKTRDFRIKYVRCQVRFRVYG